MRIPSRPGATLLELACLLALFALLISLGAPRYAHARDVLAVRATRDAIVAAAARTRAHAVRHGGAGLVINTATGTIRITSRDGVIDQSTDLPAVLRVTLRVQGAGSTTAAMAYDGLGIGRLANRTISIDGRGVAGGVTFSTYGRPRVW